MQKPLRNKSLKITPIIHLFLFASTGLIVLFQRDCGRWGPISGEIKRFEKPIDAARRETMEEIGISIESIYSTDNLFHGISPKGKRLFGITCLAPLPGNISPHAFTFNNEMSGFVWASPSDALSLLKNKGFPEAVRGFEYLRDRHLIERVTTAQEKSKGKEVNKNG